MALQYRKRAVLAAIETSYGAVTTPTGAANAVLLRGDPKVKPLAMETANRELVRPWFGNSPDVVTAVWSEVEFDVEIAGSGTAGTAPAWGVLLRGCAFAEVITAGSKVEYSPVSDGLESLCIHFHMDGVRHVLKGARGTVKFAFTSGQFPVMSFRFVGLYAPATDQALPASVFTAWQDPLAVMTGNTTASLYGLTDLGIESISLDLAGDVSHRNLVNREDVIFADRKPSGEAVFEMTSVADRDWFGLVRNATTGAITVTQGTAAGNKVTVSVPHASLNQPDYQQSKGIVMLKTSFSANAPAGNDELLITAE
ncbi:phage tail tube protein [Chitiniphilus shinanonensis]|uniref:phage tail tube protein n=1 Tax=Chitiniphilus shinanonensis TaxID=553088 RepID=UPI003074B2B3